MILRNAAMLELRYEIHWSVINLKLRNFSRE